MTNPGPIPEAVLDRYVKLVVRANDPASSPTEKDIAKRAAARMLDKHPGLLDALEEKRAREAVPKGRVGPLPPGAGLWAKAWYNLETWAVNAINDLLEEHAVDRVRQRREGVVAPHPIPRPLREGFQAMTRKKIPFSEQIATELEVIEVGDVEIDVAGKDEFVEGIEVTFLIPTALWRQLSNRRDGAKTFFGALLLQVEQDWGLEDMSDDGE